MTVEKNSSGLTKKEYITLEFAKSLATHYGRKLTANDIMEFAVKLAEMFEEKLNDKSN